MPKTSEKTIAKKLGDRFPTNIACRGGFLNFYVTLIDGAFKVEAVDMTTQYSRCWSDSGMNRDQVIAWISFYS